MTGAKHQSRIRFSRIAEIESEHAGGGAATHPIVIMSDFHMGNGGRSDDLLRNGLLVRDILRQYYYPRGWLLILNGDIEELQRYAYGNIRKAWEGLYEIFDAYHEKGRLFKTIGNHDEDLEYLHAYPYPLYDAVQIKTSAIPLLVYHGHQASKVYTQYNRFVRLSLRYFFKPLGIRNISSARSPRHRFFVEKEAYRFSLENNVISIIGHTHRPLFESLGRFDYIKFEIERLIREYPTAPGPEKERIAEEVRMLREELSKLKRSERRTSIQQSLYGDELPVPCLFNSGSVIGKKGIYGIEIEGNSIRLVYWFTEGQGKRFVHRGTYAIEVLEGTSHRRVVLNQDKLEYVRAKIELLG